MSEDRATTGQRSHRYLRLSLALSVLALFVGVGVQIARSGVWLPAISHYVYTPAGGVFVAALVAASLALVSLAGRDLETIFLDVAAVFAPIIALVPTGISAELLARVRGRDDLALGPCSPNEDCVPAENMEAVYTGVITYTVVLACVVLLALWIRRDTVRMLWRTRADAGVAGRAWAAWSTFTAPAVAVLVAVALNLAAFVEPLSAGFPFNPWLGISVHFAAAILFFAAFAAVPLVNGIRFVAALRSGAPRIATRYAVVYLLVPVLMVIDLVVLVVIVRADLPGIGVLVCEAVALTLFAAFWIAQTIQWWREDDPPHLAPPR
ncbi:MAG: hypothetical protein ACTHMQ_08410 [Protaetiibacter sp.]